VWDIEEFARISDGFLTYPKSDNNVTILLDFRAKAARMKPRRSSGVHSSHDSRAGSRVNKSGRRNRKKRSPGYFSEPKRIVRVYKLC
jgi:hypothetical protein